MKKILYFLLKKDMIKKLSKKHGTQFVDNVMETFGIPTDTTNDYLKTLKNKQNMKLGEFIEKFSHNNLIRLLYKTEIGHELVLNDWNDVSMDWEVNKQKGKNRHYINNEVLGLAAVYIHPNQTNYPEAINIVIEKLRVQPHLDEDLIKHTPQHKIINKRGGFFNKIIKIWKYVVFFEKH